MSVGIPDAHNLGWKLAAVITGRADEELLDTYHDERHPVGAEVLEHTQAQTALMTAYSPEGQALRRRWRVRSPSDSPGSASPTLPVDASGTCASRTAPRSSSACAPAGTSRPRKVSYDRTDTSYDHRSPVLKECQR